jgi:hypothetical protein
MDYAWVRSVPRSQAGSEARAQKCNDASIPEPRSAGERLRRVDGSGELALPRTLRTAFTAQQFHAAVKSTGFIV